jgi:hypothetical protein
MAFHCVKTGENTKLLLLWLNLCERQELSVFRAKNAVTLTRRTFEASAVEDRDFPRRWWIKPVSWRGMVTALTVDR